MDDEETIRFLVRDILEEIGYKVLSADDGYQAVELYRKRKSEIDLVILDMTMPGMGGRETFEKLKELNPGIRAILSTGYSEDETGAADARHGGEGIRPEAVQDRRPCLRRAEDTRFTGNVIRGRAWGQENQSVSCCCSSEVPMPSGAWKGSCITSSAIPTSSIFRWRFSSAGGWPRSSPGGARPTCGNLCADRREVPDPEADAAPGRGPRTGAPSRIWTRKS